MKIWFFQSGEPLHCDLDDPRPMRAMNLANKLVAKGHKVVLWSSAFYHQSKTHRSRHYKEITISENLEIRLIPSSGYAKNISISRFYDHCLLAWNLRSFLNTCNDVPDVAFVGYPPIEAAYVMGGWLRTKQVPFLLDVKDQWPNVLVDSVPSPVRFLARILLAPYYVMSKRALRSATGVSAHTAEFLNWALTHSNRSRSHNDFVAPLTSPSDEINPESMIRAQNWWTSQGVVNTSVLRIMFVGSFSRAFDFDAVFAAASVLREQNIACEFILCGDGDREEELRSISKEHDNVRIFGWIGRPAIKALSLISNAAIAPYKGTHDFIISVPNKIIDSLMLGLPILSPLKGEVGTLLKEYNVGFTYGDSSDLSECISSLIADSELQKSMSDNAKSLYESKFEFDSVYDGLVEHLEHLQAKQC